MTKLPSLTCPKCGELRLPKLRCWNCNPQLKRGPPTEGMIEVFKAHRERAKQSDKVFRKRYRTKLRSTEKRRLQRAVMLLKWSTAEHLAIIEKDTTGRYVIYEDRVEAFNMSVRVLKKVLEVLKLEVFDSRWRDKAEAEYRELKDTL